MPPTSPGLAEEHVLPDEAATTAECIAFLKTVSARRHPAGVVRRFNQARHSGCVEGEFTVLDALPGDCRVGLFAEPRTYRAWIRFASASSTSDREKDVRGMSIKLRGVAGENLTPGATDHDLVLNSHPTMPVAGTREFLALLQAMEAGGLRRLAYFVSHPGASRWGLAARRHHSCHLDIPYWSSTPYSFGPGRAVKYIVRPVSSRTSALPDPLTDGYLRDALAARLADDEAAFDFMIQWQTDGRAMPIEDASVEWRERDSPPVAVARLRIPSQRLDAADREQACEQVAFNPWHCLAAQRPLGSMNRARREIYRAMAEFRLNASSGTR